LIFLKFKFYRPMCGKALPFRNVLQFAIRALVKKLRKS